VHVIGHVVEVADVDPVRDDGPLAEFDVQEAVHGVIPAEYALVPHAHRALMTSESVLVANMDPPAEDQTSVATTGVHLDASAEEDEAFRDDVRIADAEDQEAPVAHEVPPRPRAIADDPSQ